MRFIGAGAEFLDDQGAQLLWHPGIHGEMDYHASAAALQRRLVGAHQILGLFLEFDVGVADQSERALSADAEAGEQPIEEQRDQVIQHDEAHSAADRTAAVG